MDTELQPSPPLGSRWRRRSVAGGQAFLGALLLFGIWVALPARWWPIDVPGTALALGCLAAAFGLWCGTAWGVRVARVTLWAALAAGCVVCTALIWVVAHLFGLYGPVGAGGALLMGVMAALILPYLVLLPALSLRLLGESE
jgi:hypothetical protein